MRHYHKSYLGSTLGKCGNKATRAKNPRPKENTKEKESLYTLRIRKA